MLPRDKVLWPAVALRPQSETISKLPSQIGRLLLYRHTETETGPDLLKSVDILDNLCYNIRPSKTETHCENLSKTETHIGKFRFETL